MSGKSNASRRLLGKLRESLSAVLPILIIVLALCFSIVPVSGSTLLCFLIGSVLLIMGMMFFTLGAELSMSPIGEQMGSHITRSRKLSVIIAISFLLGFLVTIAEPDLQVLSDQVPSIPRSVLILTIAAGVGLFLVLALLRMLFRISLNTLLLLFYILVFLFAVFVPKDLLPLAFDAGGVTTGPMTVPFIMALGVGVSAIRSDKNAADDSFGLVALCSVGPILTVMLLSLIYAPQGGSVTAAVIPEIRDSLELSSLFRAGFPVYFREMLLSILPIAGFFAVFQIFFLRLPRQPLIKILIGLAYTYIGLVLFLTGANVGFMPAGKALGAALADCRNPWFSVPVAMVIGFFVVRAEPAVYVLNKQVEEITDGGISSKTMGLSLSIGVAVSLGLSMVRVLTGISILFFLIPGYCIAILTSFFVPKLYTAIAFDSGGVCSGPMTAAFLLPLTQGVCIAVGGDPAKDAFGVVAMVAMTPLITIQILGFFSQMKEKRKAVQPCAAGSDFDSLPDDAILEL